MDQERRLKINSATNARWAEITDNISEITNFFNGGIIDNNLVMLMISSIKAIMGELSINKEKYDIYPEKDFSNEEFVDNLIEQMDKSKNAARNNEAREICLSFVFLLLAILVLIWVGFALKHLFIWINRS